VIAFPVDGFLWLIASMLLFVLAQRWMSRELQLVLLLLTRKQTFALGLFSILLFPGVFIHEASHLLTALILRVKVNDFSLRPRLMPDGILRLGYVETRNADIIRSALIGAAPIVTGGIAITYLWANHLGLEPLLKELLNGQIKNFMEGFKVLSSQPIYWLWVYLALAISSTMLPSAADRRSWLSFLLVAALLVGIGIVAGAGGWMANNVAPWFNDRLNDLAKALGISLGLQVFLAVPLSVAHYFLERLAGYPELPLPPVQKPQKGK
jgi:hypothetical protein